MMIKVLLWIALSLVTFIQIQSFSPKFLKTGKALTKLNEAASSVLATTTNGVTLTLPPAHHDDKGCYPSLLHKIHIRKLLSDEEANECCKISHEFAASTGRWDTPDAERHASYATCDFPVEDCKALEKYLEDVKFHDRLFESLGSLYSLEIDDLEYLDLFVANYQVKESDDSKIMDRLELHRDGTLLSFSLLLNSHEDFSGGGTFYDALRDAEPSGILHNGGVIRPRQGEAVLHCGKVLHGADVVTAGQRTVLVGFIDVAEYCTRDGVLAKACTDFGRMDVAARRFKRQIKKNNKGWIPNNEMFLTGHSHIKGFMPAFDSVVQRGEQEYQRSRKLEAEDTLLRYILLPEDERTKPDLSSIFGEITEVTGDFNEFDFREISVVE